MGTVRLCIPVSKELHAQVIRTSILVSCISITLCSTKYGQYKIQSTLDISILFYRYCVATAGATSLSDTSKSTKMSRCDSNYDCSKRRMTKEKS